MRFIVSAMLLTFGLPNQTNAQFGNWTRVNGNIKSPLHLLSGDFNNDGFRDLVSFNSSLSNTYVHGGTSNALEYTHHWPFFGFSENLVVNSCDTLDANNDGLLDFIVILQLNPNPVDLCDNIGGVAILLNEGDFNFSDPEYYLNTGERWLARADINGNEVPDYLFYNCLENSIYAVQDFNPGSEIAPYLLLDDPGENLISNLVSLVSDDINGDGYFDIIWGTFSQQSSSENRSGIAYGNEEGLISETAIISGTAGTQIAVGQLFGDELLEIAIINQSGIGKILIQQELGLVVHSTFENSLSSLNIVDLNADENEELLLCKWSPDYIGFRSYNEDGTVDENVELYSFDNGYFWNGGCKLGFYDDGNSSAIFLSHKETASLAIIPEFSPGEFGQLYDISHTAVAITDSAIEDIDNDGDLDIAFCASYDRKIAWLENEFGTFHKEHILEYIGVGYETASQKWLQFNIDDYDGDGFPDLAITDYISLLRIYNATGSGEYGDPVDYDLLLMGEAMVSGDLDQDFDTDIIAGNCWGSFGEMVLAEYDDGFIVQGDPVGDGLQFDWFDLVDINEDGLLDLLFAPCGAPFGLYWYENIGNLEFAEPAMIYDSEVDGFEHLDINQDGALDIVLIDQGDVKLLIQDIGQAFNVISIENVNPIRFKVAGQINGAGYLSVFGTDLNVPIHAADLYHLEIDLDDYSVVETEIYTGFDQYHSAKMDLKDVDGDGGLELIYIIDDYSPVAITEPHFGIYILDNITFEGCTDPEACNFSESATLEDGSCFYSPCFNIVDSDDNGIIGIEDLLFLLGNLGCVGLECPYDLNEDSLLNALDLLVFLTWFGVTYP